jgi:flagellar biosynthesis component FlhA
MHFACLLALPTAITTCICCFPPFFVFVFVLFCFVFFFFGFVFGFESEAQVSQFVSHGDDHPSERKKKIRGENKTVWQALESASSKTHLQCSVDYYAQQWTGS